MDCKHKVSILFPENSPKIRTKSELDLKRKNELRGIVEEFVPKICLLDKEGYKTAARVNQGLLPRPKSCTNNQSFSNCRTKSQLSSLRKEKNSTANDTLGDYSFKNSEERLLESSKKRIHWPSSCRNQHSFQRNQFGHYQRRQQIRVFKLWRPSRHLWCKNQKDFIRQRRKREKYLELSHL